MFQQLIIGPITILIIALFLGYQLSQRGKDRQIRVTQVVETVVILWSAILIILVTANVLAYYNKNMELSIFLTADLVNIVSVGSTLALSYATVKITQLHFEETRKQNMGETIAAPLYLEIEKIKDVFLSNLKSSIGLNIGNFIGVWLDFMKNHKKIRAISVARDIPDFYEQCKMYADGLHDVHNDSLPIIATELNKLLKQLCELKIKEDSRDTYRLVFENKYGKEEHSFFVRNLIFNVDVLEYLKGQYPDFNKEKVKLFIRDYRYGWKTTDFDEEKYRE